MMHIHPATLSSVTSGCRVSGMLTFCLLFLTTIVSTVALALLSSTLKVPMVAITVLELVNPCLQLAKVKLEVFIDLSHFKVLLLEVLSALIG